MVMFITSSLKALVFLTLLNATVHGYVPSEPVQLGVNPPVGPDGDRAWFDSSQIQNVTCLLGGTAYLTCRVRSLTNRTVSWVRHHDVHLLTVGASTYTSDARFKAHHPAQTQDWTLQIKFVQHRDAGMYACQVSSVPPVSYPVYLSVVEPITEVLGGPEIYIDARSTINLTCVIHSSPEPPAFIFWKHNDQVVSHDSLRGGISVVTVKGEVEGEVTSSYLIIQSARSSDSGIYSCQPAGAKEKSLKVHVLDGESPAAMQTSSCPPLPSALAVMTAILLHFSRNSSRTV